MPQTPTCGFAQECPKHENAPNSYLWFYVRMPLPVVLPKNAPNSYLWFYVRMPLPVVLPKNAPNSYLWFYLRMPLPPTCSFT